MDRRRKILVNAGENAISDLLSQAVDEHMASVCPKVGLKDALLIDRSGLPDDLYSYALKAHLDFVVVDHRGRVAFAVEFDEAHHQFDCIAIANEKKKNKICEMLGLPLVRIGIESLTHVEDLSILSWLVDRYFYYKYQPAAFVRAAKYFRNLYERGEFRPAEHEWPASIVQNFANLKMQAWTIVQFSNGALFYSSASFRNFPEFTKIHPDQIAVEISQNILYEVVKAKVESGNITSNASMGDFAAEIAEQYHLANRTNAVSQSQAG